MFRAIARRRSSRQNLTSAWSIVQLRNALAAATAPVDAQRVINQVDELIAAGHVDPLLDELRGSAIIARTNLVQKSVAVLQEARNARATAAR